MVQGAMIGVIGTLAGVGLGVLLGLNVDTVVPALERVLGFKFLAKDVYYIAELPSDVRARAGVVHVLQTITDRNNFV